ncbi:MAG TPA: pyridoxal-phosphate dependent enzyme [Dokdonella sp.]|uniref:pyridoxal-phosphate dependent enzyme n=1 Tax=Dokdonella sp. TaxID=2291710 RepID=UPI002D7F6C75|nr:pyridoxal-phosphate dependent enzyme [Dokdonella sp.]HET9032950.1 pyridoxal-phosphate dependent enzyme [Dokdonella sp.]
MTTRPDAVLFTDIEAAAARVSAHARLTPVLQSHSINERAGAELLFKCENFQRVGAFKFRGACNAVWSLTDAVADKGVVTHSSGNHGAALALAARTRGIPAHVIVPQGAIRSKAEAISDYGASVHRCAATIAAREETAERVRDETGATLVHPYANTAVIAGQGTAARELILETGPLDVLIAPVGGGGLICGTAICAAALAPQCKVIGAEPSGAADTFESLQRGQRVGPFTPDTICDGLRTLVGEINFSMIREHGVEVLTVDDEATIAAMRLIWQRMKIIVEPSAAIVLAVAIQYRERFAGMRVGLILTGGNVDLDALPWQEPISGHMA